MANNINALKFLSSPFLGSDNNSYSEETTYAQAYKNITYDITDRLNFYNNFASDEDYTIGESNQMYDTLVQQNQMVPDYSPTSDAYAYKKVWTAGKSMGKGDQEIKEGYDMMKGFVAKTALTNTLGGQVDHLSNIIGADANSFIKNTDSDLYNAMTTDYQGINNSGDLGNYLDNTLGGGGNNNNNNNNNNQYTNNYTMGNSSNTVYENLNEFLLDENVGKIKKMVVTNNYSKYLKNNETNEGFVEALPTQVYENFQNNLIYDPKSGVYTLYDFKPVQNTYKTLHDIDFWKQVVDQEKGWAGGLFTNRDEQTTKMAKKFLNSPLQLYLTDGTREEVNQDKVLEFENAFNGTFNTDLNTSDVTSVQSAVNTMIQGYSQNLDDNGQLSVNAKNTLAQSDLGHFIQKASTDKRVMSAQFGATNDIDPSVGSWIAETVSWGTSELSNVTAFAQYGITNVIGGIKHGVADLFGNSVEDIVSKQLGEIGEESGANIALSKGVDGFKMSTDILKAVDESLPAALAAENASADDYYDKNWKIGTNLHNFVSGGSIENNIRSEAFDEEFRKQLTNRLGKDTVAVLDEKGLIDELPNMNVNKVMKRQADTLTKYMQENLSPEESEEWVSDLKKDPEVLEATGFFQQSTETSMKAFEDAFVPFAENRGRQNVGLNGYSSAYDNNVDLTGGFQDLLVEVVFDPTTWFSFGATDAIKGGAKTTKGIGAGIKAGRKASKEGGAFFKTAALGFNESLVDQTASKISKEVGSGLKKVMYTDVAKSNSSRLFEYTDSVDELSTNLIKDLETSGFEMYDVEGVKYINDAVIKLKDGLDTSAVDLAKVNKNIDEATKGFKKSTSRTKRDVFSQSLSKEAKSLDKYNTDITKKVNEFVGEVNNITNALPDSTLKSRMNQYLEAFNNVVDQDNIMNKHLNEKLLNAENLDTYVKNELSEIFKSNGTYRGLHGVKTLNNLIKNADGISDEIVRYINSNSMDGADLMAMLTKKFQIGKTNTSLGRQVSNSFHDITEFVDNKLVTREKSVDRILNIKKSDAPDNLKSLAKGVVRNRKGIKNNLFHLDSKLFDEISGQPEFRDGIRREYLNLMDNKVLGDGDYDLENGIREVYKSTLKKYKAEVLNKSDNLTDAQKTLAYFADKDMVFDISKNDLRNYLKNNPISYDEWLDGKSDIVMRRLKQKYNLPSNISTENLIKRYNRIKGLSDDIDISTILDNLDDTNIDTILNDIKLGKKKALGERVFSKMTKKEILSMADDVPTKLKSMLIQDNFGKILKNSGKFLDQEIVGVLRKLSKDEIANLLPDEFGKIQSLKKLNKDKPFETLKEVLDNEAQFTELSYENFLDAVDPLQFQENINMIEDVKFFNSILAANTLQNDFVNSLLGKTSFTKLQNKMLDNLVEHYKQAGKGADSSVLNNLPNALGGDILADFNATYGLKKQQALQELKQQFADDSSKNIFNTYTTMYDSSDYTEALRDITLDLGSSTQENKTRKTLARVVRKQVAQSSKRARVHDAINRHNGVADTVVRNTQLMTQLLRKNFKPDFSNELDKLLMYKRMIKSRPEMTTSYNDFLFNTFNKQSVNSSELKSIAFSVSDNKMKKMVSDMGDIEFMLNGEDIKLSDVFNIDYTSFEPQFGDTSHRMNITLRNSGKLKDEQIQKVNNFLTNVVGDSKSYYSGGKKIKRPPELDTLQSAIMDNMGKKHPDIFGKRSIALADEETITNVTGNIDNRLREMRNALGNQHKESFDQYIQNHAKVMANVSKNFYNTMMSMDPSLELFKNSDYGKYIKTLMQREGIEFNKDNIVEFANTTMEESFVRTYYNSKDLKKIRKGAKKKGIDIFDIMTDGYSTNGSQKAIKEASVKGSFAAKNAIMKQMYGTSGDSVVTNLNTYINHASSAAMNEITRAAYGKHLPEFIKDVKTGTRVNKNILNKQRYVSINELKDGLFREQPELYNEFMDTINKKFGTSVSKFNTNYHIVFDKKDYNYLQHVGTNIQQLNDPNFIGKAAKSINKWATNTMLAGSFNPKMIMSTIPFLMMSPWGNLPTALDNLGSVVKVNKKYMKLLSKNPDAMIAHKKLIDGDITQLEDIAQVGSEFLTGNKLKTFNDYHLTNQLRMSSSTSRKNYSRYKMFSNTARDKVEFNTGHNANAIDMMMGGMGAVVNGILPNMSVMDTGVLARAKYLSENPNVLNSLLKSNYGEELVSGFDMNDVTTNAMRLAETELGITDGILSSGSTLADSIFFFRNQLTSGIPNIFATYFGTPEGLYSVFNTQKRFGQVARLSSQQNQQQLVQNMEGEDWGKFMLGFNIGDNSKMLTLNNYSPFDIITQFFGADKNPIATFYDTFSPWVKYPIEMNAGDDLGNYNMSDSNIDKYADAAAVGDTKNKFKYGGMALLEAGTGNLYRWGNQLHKLLSGKDESGKQLMYFPQSTDAEINALNSVLYQYNIKVKDGYIDEVPFISTLFNAKNLNNPRTENVINMLENYAYNDKYMEALGDEEIRPGASGIKNGIWNAMDKSYLYDMYMSHDNIGDELKKVAIAMQNGDTDVVMEESKKAQLKKMKNKVDLVKTLKGATQIKKDQ